MSKVKGVISIFIIVFALSLCGLGSVVFMDVVLRILVEMLYGNL